MGGLAAENTSSALVLKWLQPNEGSAATTPALDTKPKKKICCACPDTKKLRDECIVEHGQDVCTKWINAHLKCLRTEGFNV